MIASYLRKMLNLACVAAVLPACLITERKDYQAAPSLAPSIVTTGAASRPLDRVIVLEDVGGEDGGIGTLVFEVIVREPNVNDDMRARVFVNRPAAITDDRAFLFMKKDEALPPNVSAERPSERPYTFIIEPSELNALECNRIELFVASDFRGAFTPVDLSESARVVWWAGPRGSDLAACNR